MSSSVPFVQAVPGPHVACCFKKPIKNAEVVARFANADEYTCVPQPSHAHTATHSPPRAASRQRDHYFGRARQLPAFIFFFFLTFCCPEFLRCVDRVVALYLRARANCAVVLLVLLLASRRDGASLCRPLAKR